MDPEEDDFGFVADDFGFEEGEPLPGTAEVPGGYRSTGERVHVLPGMSFEVDAETGEGSTRFAEGPGHIEERIEKAPSAHDVEPGTIVGPDRRTPGRRLRDDLETLGGAGRIDEYAGLEPVTLDRLRHGLRVWQRNRERGEGAWESGTNALLATAQSAEAGAPESGPDMRTQAPWIGVGNLFGADELGGALGGVSRPWLGETPVDEQLYTEGAPTYESRRDDLRRTQSMAEEQAPGAYALGASLPAVPTALLPGGQGTILGRLGTAGAQGAVLGGIRGLAESEAEDAEGMLRDTGVGAAEEGVLNTLFAGAGEGVAAGARGLSRLGQGARNMASEARVAASGLNPSPSPRSVYGRQVQRMGGVEGVANRLDEANIGGRLPTPQSSEDDVLRGLATTGDNFDDVMRRMDESGVTIDRGAIADRVEQIARDLESSGLGTDQAAARRIRQEFAGFADQGDGLSFQQAHELRQRLDEIAGNFRGGGQTAEHRASGYLSRARQELSALMDDAAGSVGPEVRDQWRQANRRWQTLALLRDNARPQGSRFPGAVAESANLAQGNVAGAVASRAGGGLLSRFGPGIRARGLQGIAAALEHAGPAGQRFAQMLEQAESTGMGMPAAHFLLMRTRPEYRALIESNQEQTSE